ncbi:adenosine receptor A2b-like [Solea solea]|uniref:adenosine receptor A2b-like n=1 Tax=Solea solea TaxID=90069 RepID=UPI0027295AE6|nr:adenosine receptor A2b-like [Solea solea]
MNVTNICEAEVPFGFLPRLKGVYIATELIVAVLAISGNTLVCLAVIRNKKLRTITNYFLVSLAVADILVGLVAIPCAVLTDLGKPRYNLPLCLVLLSILMVLTQSSILSLLAVAAERYMAIFLPFQYQRMMSPRNAKWVLTVTWGTGAISGSVPLMDWQRQPAHSKYCIFTCVVDMSYMVYFNFFCCLLLPLVAMFVIYGHIFVTVRRQLRFIQSAAGGNSGTGREDNRNYASADEPDLRTRKDTVGQFEEKKRKGGVEAKAGNEVNAGVDCVIDTKVTTISTKLGFRITPAHLNSASTDLEPGASTVAKSNICTRQELRKATSLFLVLFLFTVCWLPIHMLNCVQLFCPQWDVPMPLTLAAILLSHANSALNPILYAYRMKSFRRALIAMWRVGPKH